jgi:hypothetical protein
VSSRLVMIMAVAKPRVSASGSAKRGLESVR